MRVENDCVRCTRRFPFTIHRGRRVFRFSFEQLRIKAASLHHLQNELSIAANVLAIGSYIRNREQACEFRKNLMFVSAPIVSRRGLRESNGGKNNHDHRRWRELVKPTHKW